MLRLRAATSRGSYAESSPVVIFLHLPKTAGSTLADIIKRQYGAGHVVFLYEDGGEDALEDGLLSRGAGLQAIAGHFYFGMHDILARPTAYITMLRDPVERMISHYHFVQRDETHYLFQMATELNLEEFVVARGRLEPNNDQTRLLAGVAGAAGDGLCSDDLLPIAKENLANHFEVVGLVEEFDRSVILMKRVLGWSTPYYVSRNVTRNRARRAEVPASTLQIIEAHNALDIELYRSGRQLFCEQTERQGRGMEREVRRFRRLNHTYGRIRVAAATKRAMPGASR